VMPKHWNDPTFHRTRNSLLALVLWNRSREIYLMVPKIRITNHLQILPYWIQMMETWDISS